MVKFTRILNRATIQNSETSGFSRNQLMIDRCLVSNDCMRRELSRRSRCPYLLSLAFP